MVAGGTYFNRIFLLFTPEFMNFAGMKGDELQKMAGKIVSSAASLLKVALMSRRASGKGEWKERGLVVMGNGPSLRGTIDNDSIWLRNHDLMAVNFAANTPDFFTLRPCHYVLADGHFFGGAATDPNVAKLWSALLKTDWRMTLWVPWKYAAQTWRRIGTHPMVEVKVFNLTPVEGCEWLCHWLMDSGLGMPRPRNVLIPAVMVGIREGYRKIYLAGADHSWTRTLSVDDENFVVSVQPHFYSDNEEEHKRVRSTYAGLHLHDVLGSMTVAFRSYWQIASYAKEKGVEIINATPGSMIDAFPRLQRRSPAASEGEYT